MLRYDEDGNLDFAASVDPTIGVPSSDVAAAPAILNRHDGQFVYVDLGHSGARGPMGEFRIWDGRVWRRDANETVVHRWINTFWVALYDAITNLERHIETVAANRRSELIRSGMAETAARRQVAEEVIKPMKSSLRPLLAYHTALGKNSNCDALAKRMTRRGAIVKTVDDFDAVEQMLVCGNVVLDFTDADEFNDISRMHVHAHSSTRMVSMSTTTDYRPEARCPLFMSYIEGVLPDPETRRFLQKVLGSALLGKPRGKTVVNLIGERSSGKSVLLTVLQHVLGKQYVESTMAKTFIAKRGGRDADGPSPALHALRKAKMVVSSEPDAGDRWDAGLLKTLTGRDEVTSRAVYGREILKWRPRFVIILASNQFVRLSVEDQAMVKRVAPVHFPVTFLTPGRDMPAEDIPPGRLAIPDLDDRICRSDEEMSGVLNWLIEGLALFFKEGLQEPDSIEEMRMEMEADSSQAIRWLRDRMQDDVIGQLSLDEIEDRGSVSHGDIPPKAQRMQVSDAYADYKAWCTEQEIGSKYRQGKINFARDIAKSGGSSTSKTVKLPSGQSGFDRLYWKAWRSGYTGEVAGKWDEYL
jgi:phage/plasmid-associated DNA primase